MNKMNSGLGFFGLVLLLVLVPIQATAENDPTALDENQTLSEDWQYSLRPYFYLSGLSGSISVESVTYPINSSFSTLLDNVKIGALSVSRPRRASGGSTPTSSTSISMVKAPSFRARLSISKTSLAKLT